MDPERPTESTTQPSLDLRERLLAAGIPAPTLTDEQRAEFDRRLQAANDEAERFYGSRSV